MSILQQLLVAIFGRPDITKIGLAIRGFLFALGGAALSGALDLGTQVLGQLGSAEPIVINWQLALRTFLLSVGPVLLMWGASLAAWMKAQSSVSVEQLNRLLEISIALPQGATVEDAKAIYHREVITPMDARGR